MGFKGFGEMMDAAGEALAKAVGIPMEKGSAIPEKEVKTNRTNKKTVYNPVTGKTTYEDGTPYEPEADGFNHPDANRIS